MEARLGRKVAQAALAAVVGLGCAGSAATLALAESHVEATVAYAAQKAGWKKSGGKWWYAHAGSGYAKGWEKIGGKWYLFDKAGWMQTGWQKSGGKWYWLGSDGAMRTGWQKSGGKWYYLKGSGAMATGWLKSGGEWYWLEPSGAMATGWRKVGKEWYWLGSDGAMRTGWQQVGKKWYYLEKSGAMAAGKWVGDYYLTSSGAMATSAWVGKYWVGADGKWVPGAKGPSGAGRPQAPNKPQKPSGPQAPDKPAQPGQAGKDEALDPANYPEKGEIDYADGAEVQEGGWEPESESAVVVDPGSEAADARPGDVVVFEPSEEDPQGLALKVTSVEDEGGETRIEGAAPELSEVVDSMEASGTTGDFVYLEMADGVSLVDDGTGETVARAGACYGWLDFDHDGSLGLEDVGIKDKTIDLHNGLKLKIDPRINYSIDFRDGKLRECTVVADVEAKLNFDCEASSRKERKLFSGTCATKVPGLYVTADFYLVTSATGEVSIEARMKGAAGFSYKDGRLRTVSDKGFSYEASFDAELRAGLAPEVSFDFLRRICVADLYAEVGVGVEGRLEQRDALVCADMSAFFYEDVSLAHKDNLLADVLEALDVGTEYHPITKDDGALGSVHVENGEVVPKCTWGKPAKPEEPSKPSQPSEPSSSPTPPSGDVIPPFSGGAGEATPASDFEYEIKDDGVYITSYEGTADKVVVPNNIEGKPVVFARIWGDGIVSLDASKVQNLVSLYCEDNDLTSLDVSGCPSLERLTCGINNLTSLDISGCPSLEVLLCGKNSLTSLDVSGCPRLETLRCSENSLTSLDVSGCTNLVSLYCENNGLTSLDVSGCPRLETLKCSENSLTSLDVSGCTNLESLLCSNSGLTSLDVFGCVNLAWIECWENSFDDAEKERLKAWANESHCPLSMW
ncbi:hypothetical protein GMI69_01915 [Eggerthellaceae bacterium zg-887]|uniref:leucine-rich repeat domain-containing protein n=1 Tax=Xiamenia xianingshaonis TaxID=2682776 RepID=UPI0014075AE6|nr:leucine-rich repeat domain-containing protein [Xiamenia xianingshaonis]NHM15429.1 hypothetical protein [Xiamenia xianingshaonis]